MRRTYLKFLLLIPLIMPLASANAIDKILFFTKKNDLFKETSDKIKTVLANKNEFREYALENNSTSKEFEAAVKANDPQFLILMDNISVELAIKYNKTHTPIRGLALMALNLRHLLEGNKEIAAIEYEPPIYTLVTDFQYIFGKRLKKILVFYRKSVFGKLISISTAQLNKENIQLIPINVEEDGASPEAIANFLGNKAHAKLSQEKPDALWMMLDSVLLGNDFLQKYWISLAKDSKIPVLTQHKSFVDPGIDLSVFANYPNLSDMAQQAGQIVGQVLNEGIAVSEIGIEQMPSAKHAVNTKKAKELSLESQNGRLEEEIEFLK